MLIAYKNTQTSKQVACVAGGIVCVPAVEFMISSLLGITLLLTVGTHCDT